MPTLRPLSEPVTADAGFFLEAVVPACAAAGFAGSIALSLLDSTAARGSGVPADVVVEATGAELSALLAGKQRAEPTALERLKAEKHGTGAARVVIRGKAAALRALANALVPRAAIAKSTSREVAAEASSTNGKARRANDLVRRDGHYVKGRPSRSELRAARSTQGAPARGAEAAAQLQHDGRAAPDRVTFALQNLAAYLNGALAAAAGEPDDVELELSPGQVRRV